MKFNNLHLRIEVERREGVITKSRLFLSDKFECAQAALLKEKSFYPPGTPFQQAVWAALQKVPFGETISYGKLAELAGYPKAARAVGGACHGNPLPFFIPCHRVIQADGKLGGYALDLEIKRRLLEWERNHRGKVI
jgi:O-6-methylguanine DNA methyltransferase